jgi:hypothetical protein
VLVGAAATNCTAMQEREDIYVSRIHPGDCGEEYQMSSKKVVSGSLSLREWSEEGKGPVSLTTEAVIKQGAAALASDLAVQDAEPDSEREPDYGRKDSCGQHVNLLAQIK